MGVLAAVRRSPVPETDGDIVEKPIVGLGDGFERASHNDDHVEEEKRVVLVICVSRPAASFAATIVNRVPLLEHLESTSSVKLRVMHGGQKVLS